jgi:hypothetical protein
MRMSVRSFALAATSLIALATPAAHAQNASESAERDEIVVTAQLREQDPIDVPIALSVFGGEQLDRMGIEEFDEFSRFVPGFEVQNQSPNNPGFVMRGITSDSGSAFNEPRVSAFRMVCRSPSRADPMSNSSIWNGSRWPRALNRRFTDGAH